MHPLLKWNERNDLILNRVNTFKEEVKTIIAKAFLSTLLALAMWDIGMDKLCNVSFSMINIQLVKWYFIILSIIKHFNFKNTMWEKHARFLNQLFLSQKTWFYSFWMKGSFLYALEDIMKPTHTMNYRNILVFSCHLESLDMIYTDKLNIKHNHKIYISIIIHIIISDQSRS